MRLYIENYFLSLYYKMSVCVRKINDLKMGAKGELLVKDIIENELNMKLYHTGDKYSLFDLENNEENVIVEIKTRRYSKWALPSFFFPAHKLKYKAENNPQIYICFNLTDGVYLFDYTKDKEVCKILKNRMCRKDRGRYEYSTMIDCPTTHFKLLHKK